MNTLSKLLYLADVTDKLGGALPPIAAILALLTLFRVIMTNLHNDMSRDDEQISISSRITLPVVGAVAATLMACALPSKTTIYMIAASQFGEAAIQSEDGVLLRNLVRQKIEEALTPSIKK